MLRTRARTRRLPLRTLAAAVLAVALVATTVVLLLGPQPPLPLGRAHEQQPQQHPQTTPRGSEWKPEFPASGSTTVALFGRVNSAQLFGVFGHVALGSPPQLFQMLFETSEDVVWIPNTRASPASPHAVYDHSKSRSYEADGTRVMDASMFYAYLGFVSRDTLRVGGLALANASFAEVTHVQDPPNFDDVTVDGVFGLSPDLERNAVLRRLAQSDALAAPLFAFYFNKQARPANRSVTAARLTAATSVGELSIGAINRSRFKGEIQYLPTLDNKRWRVELDDITVSNDTTSGNFATTEMVAPVTRDGRAVVQAEVLPSWPLILGPAEDVKRLAKAVGVTGGGKIDCSSHGPDIVIHLGGIPYMLTKDDYTLHDDADDDDDVDGGPNCRWAFAGLDLGVWWLGQPFLHKFYSVFEFGKGEDGSSAPRVGFALAA
ncbi:hypothetical protein PybrP1_002857 [[Pythium] brassicae (nom. inval.)]|nr:hypothetical protein PybrP1_002857 [[Pythium] brassicae (nom. inval.)]